MRFWVELSGENLPLARAEARETALALRGKLDSDESSSPPSRFEPLDLQNRSVGRMLASRLALAWRVYEVWPARSWDQISQRMQELGASGATAKFRIHDQRSADSESDWREAVRDFVRSGGRVDLDHGEIPITFFGGIGSELRVAEEIASIDRKAFEGRNAPRLPFHRPITLPPRRARALVNLARVLPGHAVVDPFLGTGALLAEAGILGARVSGVDRDPEMVRGALRNFEHLGLTADRLVVGDAAEAFVPNGGRKWDALISDVPYGRASTTKGEAPSHLLQRVLVEWAPLLKRRGRMAIVVPRGTPLHIADWSLTLSIEERRHRSLNREFRVYVHSSNQ